MKKMNLQSITLIVTSITFMLFGNLSAQDSQDSRSVFQTKINDTKAVYFLKENFDVHGDGIRDDAPALQAAIDFVEEQSTRGIIFIPEGTYRLGKTVYIWRGIKLIGYGKKRPVFLLGENTPGFREGDGKYMFHFCDARDKDRKKINDAANTTMYSEINNINIQIEKGNPAAIAARFHVAQLCAFKHVDFMIGTARAAIEEAGNIIEDCKFYGGEWAIKTGRTSPGWQILLLDCSFEGQRTAAIETNDAGMTIIRCKFKNSPMGISVIEDNERLFVKDTWFENIDKAAMSIFHYYDPKTQINLENVKFSDVPVSLTYHPFGHGTSRTVKIPDNEVNGVVSYKALGKFYEIKDYSHGLVVEYNNSKELDRSFNTVNVQTPLESMGEFPAKDIPNAPAPETWVNIVDLGAKGDGTTDNTAIFKNAIEKYKRIYIPMGNYRLTATLELKEQTSLIGLHPYMTRLVLSNETTDFADTLSPKPLLITPKGGSNIIRGIGFDLNLNPGAIAIKWMAGKQSYLEDMYFSTIRNVPKGTGQYYGVWVTEGGGGVFKNIWAFNDRARNGFYVSNTKTEGKVYEISVEHHKDYEVKMDNIENWTFYNLQTEEDGGSEKCIAVNIDNCQNLEFVNYVSYRIMAMGTPARSAFEINNSNNIIIKGVHIISGGAFPYDNSVYIKDNNVLVPARDFTLLNVNK